MIPTSPEQFSLSWLEDALDAPSGSLNGFTHKRLGTGQMSDSFRLTLDWTGHDGPQTIIAKCPSHDEQSRNIATVLSSYVREVNWYAELAGKSPVNRPHCYFAEIDENRCDFALLLGDCAPAEQGDQIAGADAATLRPAIIQMAALHAPFWNKALEFDHPWLPGDSRPIVLAALPGFAKAFVERYAERLAPDILDLCREFAANIAAYLDYEGSARSVIHTDFRLDNLLFAPDGGITVVDWQTLGYGCPFADLSYLIGTSIADPAARRAEEEALFDYYLSALQSHGVTPDRDAAWRDYRVFALSGVMMAIFASMSVERTERGDEMFALMAERPALQAIDLCSLGLLG